MYHPLVLKIFILYGCTVHFMDKFSSPLDDPSTFTNCNCHLPWMIHLLRGLKVIIHLGWSVHFMDLIRLFPFVDDPSTLDLSYSSFSRWSVHFMDLSYSSFLDDPSTLGTWSIHPFWMIRPLYGLDLFILLGWSVHFMNLFILLWMIRPLCGLELFILLWMICPLYGLEFSTFFGLSIHFINLIYSV